MVRWAVRRVALCRFVMVDIAMMFRIYRCFIKQFIGDPSLIQTNYHLHLTPSEALVVMVALKVQLAVVGTKLDLDRGGKLEAHIVIGTPGKFLDWLKWKTIGTKNAKIFVLDEADGTVEESGHRAIAGKVGVYSRIVISPAARLWM
jgi:hypothetical protein